MILRLRPAEVNIMKENTNTDWRHFQMQGPEAGPAVLISAGVHGDEYEAIVAAMRLAELLPGLLKKGRVTLVCLANPSAYEQNSRFGEDGLDMARICPGREEGSPTEVAAFGISQLIENCDYYVDMHTGGALFDIVPLAGYLMHSDRSVLARQRQMAACFAMPVIWGTDGAPNGRTLSVARDAKVPAIYLEYGGGGPFNELVVESYVQGFLHLLAELNMTEMDRIICTEPQYWVEDSSPDSGHLQAKMLSEYEGIFVPSISNGARVRKGQTWGVIYDPLRNRVEEVTADSDGIVLFTRRSAKVKKGESLGGILSLNDERNKGND